jgi:hypothetical protein
MKKTTIIIAAFIAVSAISLSFVNKDASAANTAKVANVASVSNKTPDASATVAELSSTLNKNLGLEKLGLKSDAISAAVKGYLKLKEEGKLQNEDLLTIVDMSQSGRSKRFYLIDMKNQQLLVNTYVAHGKGSGLDKATDFSNVNSSNKTSLGFYVTKGTYAGKHGTSLRLSGQEAGFNDQAEARGIVIHAADYVNESRVNSAYMGRSQGCPALSGDVYMKVIDLIKGGSALFIYYPDAKYTSESEYLNS